MKGMRVNRLPHATVRPCIPRLDFSLALAGARARLGPSKGAVSAPGARIPPDLLPGPAPVVPGGAKLMELRLEPGPRPRLHLRVTHPVHREVAITIIALPEGVRVEVRCADPGSLARRWPQGSRRLRVRFVKTTSGDPVQARRQPAI